MARNKKLKVPVIEIPLLANAKVLVFDGFDQFIEYTEKYDLMVQEDIRGAIDRAETLAEAQGACGALEHVDHKNHTGIRNGFIFFILIDKPSTDVIVHETAHLTFYLFEGLGIPLSSHNSEIFCYTQDYIFSEVCRILDIPGLITDEEWADLLEECVACVECEAE
jgi:hypothetical protein